MFQLYSDLHLELTNDFTRFPRIHDTIILAGDIGHINSQNFRDFIRFCAEQWKYVVYVPGNREFYSDDTSFRELKRKYKTFCSKFHNVYFLYRRHVRIRGVLFYGATMWTPSDRCQKKIHNFDQKDECWKDLQSLQTFLMKHNMHRQKIIITHFPIISNNVCHPKYNSQPQEFKRYFSSNWWNVFPEEIVQGIMCILYGHTHKSGRQVQRNTWCIANQQGYQHELCEFFEYDGDVLKFAQTNVSSD